MLPKVVAVAGGTGGLGMFITEELCKRPNIKVVVLTRDASKSQAAHSNWTDKGVVFKAVDYGNLDSLKNGLAGVHTLVSALATTATGSEQIRLADAAKAAGVSLFMPSEFGIDTSNPENAKTMDIIVPKVQLAEHCCKIGLRTVRVMSGCFIDTFFLPWFGVDLEKGTAEIIGNGTEKMSLTHRRDVGKFVAQIVEDDVRDPVVLLSGDTSTMNDALKTYERVKGKKVQPDYRSIGDTQKRIRSATDVWEKGIASIKLALAMGRGLHTDALKPKGFTPVTVEDYFKSM